MTPFACRNAARYVQQGKVIAYPTEAVFGLGCHPLDAQAVKQILKIKQRPVSKGLILIASDFSQLRPYVADVADEFLEQAFKTWPGPNTWLFPKNPATPYWLTGDFETIAVRVSAHPVVQDLCNTAGTALVSTSANRSQQEPARSALQCRFKQLSVDMIVNGQVDLSARPSVITDLLSGKLIRT
ncbi:MAG: tRNA threonylcarbamoyladenosine biosynthesis protein RimN [Gammaproteobacteria bacterium]|nr:Sua5/YciO/YrdC/YwlC family protein [Gammaproteobacteria bacterium]NNJ90324.1 tRNA threonylcarbamoyladenosine biosynthesis protein RimN [Gammaproteobacteria bacterium]